MGAVRLGSARWSLLAVAISGPAGALPETEAESPLLVVTQEGRTKAGARTLAEKAEGGTLSVGIENTLDEGQCAQDSAKGFRNVMAGKGQSVKFDWRTTNPWERDFNKSSAGGNDDKYVDSVDAQRPTASAEGRARGSPSTSPPPAGTDR